MDNGQIGMLVFYILFGFLSFCILTFGIIVLILWNRRKLKFCNFINDSGQWVRQSFKQIGDTFDFEGCTYKYDIKKCTRDKINRPIAHYYKGNPEQMVYNYAEKNKKLVLGTAEIMPQDFKVLMLSHIIKEIFSDDELKTWLIILIGTIIICAIATIIIVKTHKPPCILIADNTTINTIVQGVRVAIKG